MKVEGDSSGYDMFSPPNLKEEILDVLAPFSIVSVFTVLQYRTNNNYDNDNNIIIIIIIVLLMGCTVLGCQFSTRYAPRNGVLVLLSLPRPHPSP